MSELRRDPVIGQWVIVHTHDSWVPENYQRDEIFLRQAASCQFCPGREHQTPPEVEAIRRDGSSPNTKGWQVRVVPNKFPALRIEGELNKHGVGMFDMSNGIGAHEVLIETPDHYRHIADLSQEEAFDVISKYQSRLIDLTRDRRFKYVVIFKNYGESAGASVEHPHSQIIALPMIPKFVLEEIEGAERYYVYRGRCVFCDKIEQEYADKKRIITENEDFIVFCPFVPRYPFESWIFPKRHSNDFGSMNSRELFHLSSILKETLYRVKIALGNPSYNYYLHVAPINYQRLESFHWHIEIVPNLTRVAGFEWGTGFYVVRTSPEMAAEYLRKVEIVNSGTSA